MELSDKQKNLLFKVFIFAIVEFLCFITFVTIAGLTGNFEWTIEQLTGTPIGLFLQILNLVIVIDGILIFLYFLAFIITLISG
ncbi:MAG: hypothetical protein ACFE96_05845 [Candidatus Hermodarchaeota archaeon]